MPRFPDFFVVGAPRCGTTSFCRYLARNPQICFSQPKEPHYFSKLGPGAGGELQRDYLERCFAHRRPEHRCAGEGSVSYIYSPEAIERILSLNPRARFVVMVRNPLDMLLSYHLRLLYLLEEDQEDLATAWRLQPARARGERLPRLCTEPRLLQYAEAGSLGSWLERLQERAGAPQCLAVVYDDFAARLAAAVRNLRVGNGLEGETDQGPLIDTKALAKVQAHVADAQSKGAKVVTGGKAHALGGTFYEPTVLTHVNTDMILAREETFGPVAPLFRVDDDAEAIRLANATEFGLAAYLYTRDLARSWRVTEALEYGIVGLNTGLISTEVAPFGGVKESGFGREGSKYGILDYTELKYVCTGI